MKNAISWFQKIFHFLLLFFIFSTEKAFHSFISHFCCDFVKKIIKLKSFSSTFFPLLCTFFWKKIERKLLAVLRKFTNNTQSETSSMAFTNFHSCLKNSFFFPFFMRIFFVVLFCCMLREPKTKKHRIMNNCSCFLKRSFVKIASRTTRIGLI